MPGKYWKPEEEQLLRSLWESGVHDMQLLAEKIGRTREAIKGKLLRMGLVVKLARRKSLTTSALELPKELPSVEEALKIRPNQITKPHRNGQILPQTAKEQRLAKTVHACFY